MKTRYEIEAEIRRLQIALKNLPLKWSPEEASRAKAELDKNLLAQERGWNALRANCPHEHMTTGNYCLTCCQIVAKAAP